MSVADEWVASDTSTLRVFGGGEFGLVAFGGKALGSYWLGSDGIWFCSGRSKPQCISEKIVAEETTLSGCKAWSFWLDPAEDIYGPEDGEPLETEK